jgi:hypothetical protein
MLAIAELMNEGYRISPPPRVYDAYVEQLEHARMFEGAQGLGASNGLPFGGNTTSSLNIASNG